MNLLRGLWYWFTQGPEDWRRSFTHENKNCPVGEPPLKLKKSIRLTEGPVQRRNGSGGPKTPKPELLNKDSSSSPPLAEKPGNQR
jgi:hypothetical protein